MSQRLLQLTLHTRTALVTSDTVRAVHGLDAETIAARVDAGEFLWVWDVSLNRARKRELRFLAEEVRDPASYRKHSPDEVIATLLPGRERLRTAEVAQLLCVCDPHVMNLLKSELTGPRVGHSQFVLSASLRQFLLRRHLAAGHPCSSVSIRG